MTQTEMLAAIRSTTESMKSAAEGGEWPVVYEQEESRQELIEALFSKDIDPKDAPMVRDTINFVLDSDKEILSMAAESKNKIHGQVKQLSIEKRAFEEYAKN